MMRGGEGQDESEDEPTFVSASAVLHVNTHVFPNCSTSDASGSVASGLSSAVIDRKRWRIVLC
eukprot:1663383-Pyramimonas_sp.AAC.1